MRELRRLMRALDEEQRRVLEKVKYGGVMALPGRV
jgi:hypothetical protein